MDSFFIKRLMAMSGSNWDEVLDARNDARKKHLQLGGTIILDSLGEEIWIDIETQQSLSKFEIKSVTNSKSSV